MRTTLLRLVAALGVLGAVSATASAAPTLNGVAVARAEHAPIVQADYYWHHHHYDHRRWEHDHWRYW
jgi:hypothetical protein